MEKLALMVQIGMLAVWMYGLPTAAGGCLFSVYGSAKAGWQERLIAGWVSGQMLLWGCFQVICVPFVLLEKEFGLVVKAYGALVLLIAAAGIFLWIRESKKAAFRVEKAKSVDKKTYFWWILFAVLLFFQLAQAVLLAYADGDDAYYVAVSAITEEAQTMYRKLPYTGGSAEVDIRHGLAPFPVWIAFLARISGIKAAAVAHTAMPLMLIPMTYGIFYLLGKKLFQNREKGLPLFMVMTEVLVMFGDYSLYTVEHFMLARSRQGKAALGSIVLPGLMLLMLVLMERLEKKRRINAGFWGLLCCVLLSGCLCSTLGAFLMSFMVAVTGLCAGLVFRNGRILIPMALCCMPCAMYLLLYALNG